MKEKIAFIIKYLFGISLLVWILTRFDTGEIFRTMINFEWPVLSLILFLVVINLTMQFLRWRYLISTHSTDFQTSDLLPAFFAGFAFRMMIPGGYAEVTKVLMMPGKKGGKVVAFGLEKYLETYIKVVLILLALPLIFQKYEFYFWISGTLAIIAYFLLPKLLKTKYLLKLRETEVAYFILFFKILSFTIVIFSLLVLQYVVLLNQLSDISVFNTVLTVIFIWGGGLIPVTVSGIGVNESIAIFLFGKYGIQAEVAAGVSLFIFFLNAVLPALFGLVFISRRRHEIKGAGKDIKRATKNLYQQYTEYRKKKNQ